MDLQTYLQKTGQTSFSTVGESGTRYLGVSPEKIVEMENNKKLEKEVEDNRVEEEKTVEEEKRRVELQRDK